MSIVTQYNPSNMSSKLEISFVLDEGYVPDDLFSENHRSRLLRNEVIKKVKDNDYKFTFVGVVFQGNKAICVLPKKQNPNANNAFKLMSRAVRGMRKYGKSEKADKENTELLEADPDSPTATTLGLYAWLLDDYREHGIIRKRVRKNNRNQQGQVDWQKTVTGCTPVISAGNVIYIDPVMRRKQVDHTNMLSRIQKHILANMDPFYLELLGEKTLDLSHEPFEALMTDDIDLLNHYLILSLREAFSDREIRLIKILQAILGKNLNQNSGDNLSMYGVRKFWSVWEAMIKNVFGHQEDWNDRMPLPLWEPSGSSSKHCNENNKIIPDCIHLEADKPDADSVLWILDAKYYSIQFDANGLAGQPGVQDVIKQFCYSKAFDLIGNQKKRNCFLFPGHGETLAEYLGNVSMTGLFPGKFIECYRFSFEKLCEHYLQGNIINPSDAMKSLS